MIFSKITNIVKFKNIVMLSSFAVDEVFLALL